jgi:hypothetical protein
MTTIVTRAGKGSALTHNEVDANFTNLNNAKYESGDSATLGASSISANTTTDALRITQTGSGNAFVVEDSTSPDATPFVIDALGRVLIGQTAFSTNYTLEIASANPISSVRYANNVNPPTNLIGKSRSTTPGVFSTVLSGDNLGILAFAGDDGTAFTQAASISSAVDGTPGTNDMPGRLVFSTTPDGSALPVERMRITSAGNVLIGTTTTEATLTINGNAKIGRTTGGIPSTGTKLTLEADLLEGINTPVELLRLGWTDSPNIDQLNGAGTKISFYQPSATIANEVAYVGAIKASGAESDQGANLVFATSPTGSTSSTPPTERMRIDQSGNVSIGGSGLTNRGVMLQRALNNSTTESGFAAEMQINSIVTSQANIFSSAPTIENATFTLSNLRHFYAQQGTKGASATITNQVGFLVESNLTGATNNYGFHTSLASATGRWNFYAAGTAPNYFAGDVRSNTVIAQSTSPTNSNTSATATASSLLGGIRTGTPTANINLTLPTGTNMDAAFQNLETNQTIEWSVINLAAAIHVITVVANTAHTVVGNMAVAANSSARFMTRKTAANTFITYRGA